MEKQSNRIIALLGPTNTGKTYVAIEKMLEFNTGIFGLPLRLLAREVYDKCVEKVGIENTLDDRVGQPTRLRRVPNTVNMSSSDNERE